MNGSYQHILPAIESLDFVELITTTKANPIKHSKMGEFYSRGHLYLCMSANEGTPMPLLEAMACGRPVISTNAGIAPEVVNKQCGWLIPRTTESLISALEDSFSKINKSGERQQTCVARTRSRRKRTASTKKAMRGLNLG